MNVRWLLGYVLLCGAGIVVSADAQKMAVGVSNGNYVDGDKQTEFVKLTNAGKVKEAITVYGQLPINVRNEPVFRLAYFDLLIESDKLADAFTLGSEIVKDFPHCGRVLCAKGVQRILSGNLEDGQKLLQRAIDVDPWYSQSYYELAKVSTDTKIIVSLCTRGILMSKGNKELTGSLTQLLTMAEAKK